MRHSSLNATRNKGQTVTVNRGVRGGFFCLLLVCGFSLSSLANAQLGSPQSSANIFESTTLNTGVLQSILPAESAFALNAYIETPNTIVLNWEIQPGYYLYRDSLAFTASAPDALATPVIPAGIQHHDEFFGDVEVYYQQLLVRIPFDPESLGHQITLDLRYQGCAEERYCYPMQSQSVTLDML